MLVPDHPVNRLDHPRVRVLYASFSVGGSKHAVGKFQVSGVGSRYPVLHGPYLMSVPWR